MLSEFIYFCRYADVTNITNMAVVKVKMISERAADITLLKSLLREGNIRPQCFGTNINMAAN